jgi:DNA-binding CsgD family transcriptional regulator
MLQPYDFTVPELNRLRELCNFSDDELEYFNLRAKHKSNTYISIEMSVSEGQVSKLAKRVKDKIKRVIPYM